MAILLYTKKYAETLDKMLERFRNEEPQYKDSKITYAGRLDPMAEGLMILLTDEDVHKKQEYLDHTKVYEVEFFFGPLTDTLDILGVIQDESKPSIRIPYEKIKNEIAGLRDILQQQYPAYSSKTVDGKPLWLHAREGTIDDINIPLRNVKILSSEFISQRRIPTSALASLIQRNISLVVGDFRQEIISEEWKNYFSNNLDDEIILHTLRVHVSTGTYVRGLVSELGKRIGIPATSIKIKRISIGDNVLT